MSTPSFPIPVRGITFGTPRRVRERRRRALAALLLGVVAVTGIPVAAPNLAGLLDGGTPVDAAPLDATQPGGAGAGGGAATGQTVDEHAPTGHDDLDGLTPAMRGSVVAAQQAAAAAGITIEVVSGHRDAATQARLYEEAVHKYGSAGEARKWVLPAELSEHVKGGAVDVQPRAAAAWLEEHGVRFGLCRRYDNEWWHFERLAGPKGATCPAREPYAGG